MKQDYKRVAEIHKSLVNAIELKDYITFMKLLNDDFLNRLFGDLTLGFRLCITKRLSLKIFTIYKNTPLHKIRKYFEIYNKDKDKDVLKDCWFVTKSSKWLPVSDWQNYHINCEISSNRYTFVKNLSDD